MDHIHVTCTIDRRSDEVVALFDRPVDQWMPVIVGPDEGTWRTRTSEGFVGVTVVLDVRDVWTLPDGTRRRRVVVQPDWTAYRNLLTALLTPRVEGELRLTVVDPRRTRLEFDGRAVARSVVTGWLERRLLGTPLGRSGVQTLMGTMARQLGTYPLPAGGAA